jgi:poly(A) polymerase
MQITGSWIKAEGLQAVLAMLTEAGHQAYLVGGCVRNAILGQPVADIDIATDAQPKRVMELAEKAGLRALPTGFEHGTITIIAHHEPHEVTTFRRDVETKGRHAIVAFSNNLEEDAARRDFTMNALYADATGAVIDPLGGLSDLAARNVRFVGAPEDRIREDYLRILRFFRFTAWYGDALAGPDPEGLAACAALADGVEGLSRERVGHEMRKLLAAPDPAPAIAAMQASGVLMRLLPGADSRALALLVHLEAGLPPSWIRRLAALGGETSPEALRLSRAEVRSLATLSRAATSAEAPAVLGYRVGEHAAVDAMLLRAALLEQPLPSGWQASVQKGARSEFPVSATDLMPEFQGPDVGKRLRQLETRWIESGFSLTRTQLLR